MQVRSLVRCGLVAVLAVTLGACRLPTSERRRAPDVPARQGTADAGDTAVVPTTEVDAMAVPADVEPDGVPVPKEPRGFAAGFRPNDLPPDSGSGAHCPEPPERIAARERMRQMAERHAGTAARLRALRAELEAHAKSITDGLSPERIPGIAADLAARAAEAPDAPPVNAGFLGNFLGEVAFWAALCRALQDGPAECDRLDSAGSGDGGYCRSVARLVRLARKRPSGLSPLGAIGAAFGWTWDRLPDEWTWQVVFHGKSEAACDRLAGPDPPERWHGPLCRALAARDVSRCAALAEDSRRRTCAALVHAILGPGTAAGDRPSAAGALLREHVAPTGPGEPCAAGIPRVLAELFNAVDVFEPGPLVLPDIERQRGLAPEP